MTPTKRLLRAVSRAPFASGLAAAGALVAGGLLARAAIRRGRSIDLAGRTALVTGGSRGLGLLIADELARRGARVAICGRDPDAVVAAEQWLRHRGRDVVAISCDVGERVFANALVDEVVERLGGLEIVVNCAGVIEVGPLSTVTVEQIEKVVQTNLFGTVNVTMRALPHLRDAGRAGRIVNIGSVGGRFAMPHMLAYDTSKFAVLGFSEALRTELADDGPRVVTVQPGMMRTGSFYNARFTGDRAAELAWFSVLSSQPVLSMNARDAADRIVDATVDGRTFLTLGLSGHAGDLLHRISPRLAIAVAGLAGRALPQGGASGAFSARGRDVESDLPGSSILKRGDAAARHHNEDPPLNVRADS
jgi:NAD(P)-dependent dehydrogenase (short-subunit alcohol dehydrogenase family)